MRIIKKLKKIIDKILNKINYHHKNSFKKKDYNSFIEGILISEILKNKKIQIIQVGANDGVKGDPLRNFVTKYSDFIKLLAIEPQEVAFENLKKNYLGYKNIFFSNKAVGNGYEKNFYFFNKNYSDLNNTNDINYEFKNLSEERLKILNIFLTKNGYEIIRWNKSDEIACKFN